MMQKTTLLTKVEIEQMGFLSVGEDVRISRKASFYGADHMRIGDHVRIDDFCILSGKIDIGNYIHIAAGTYLYGGQAGITLHDFANLSSRICIYAVSDDYSGETMTNPLIPDQYKHIEEGSVDIGRHVIIGTGSTVLPGVTIGEGCAFGAYSLIKANCSPWGIYVGIPCKRSKERSKNLLELEKQFLGGDESCPE